MLISKLPKFMQSRTILLASCVSLIAVAAGVSSMFGPVNDDATLAKKAALEESEFSAAQLPSAAACYDSLLTATPSLKPEVAAQTCKCLVSEVDKYAEVMRPALTNLMLIGLKASAATSDAEERNIYVRTAISKDKSLIELPSEQHPILQSGIRNVSNSCPIPGA